MMKNSLYGMVIAAGISGCVDRPFPKKETIETDFEDIGCNSAQAELNFWAYFITCDEEHYFYHKKGSGEDYLRWGEVEYWDFGPDNYVDVIHRGREIDTNLVDGTSDYLDILYRLDKYDVEAEWESLLE